jgi:TetR/AcrR family transcriptional regulator
MRPPVAEERRAATVQAVVDLAAEQNPAEITTTAIADRMGLTQGALFRHFPTKDAILEATMTWVGERLLVAWTRRPKAPRPLPRRSKPCS